jgi:GNAT superfamily N-acetyltransferase
MKVEVVGSVAVADLDLIAQGLNQYAAESGIESRNGEPLGVLLRDDDGQLQGGLVAITLWRWLHIKELWVAECWRGQDLGTQLMSAAEYEARRRGCHHALLDTFDFQARPFYEKLGYAVFGELSDFPRGHCRYFMSKQL